MASDIKTDQAGEKKRCLRIGITGGIGSGKSTVCRIFEQLGAPVYDADYWAKWLISNDPEIKAGIIDLFGPAAYSPEGVYQRAFIADIVFKDAQKLAALNALTHPAVARHGMEWHEARAAAGAPYTLKEAALMIESGSYRALDRLIVVTAPEDIRIQRVMQRDGLSEAEVQARMARQMPETEKIRLADYTIVNDGAHLLIPQARALHRIFAGTASLQ